MMKSFCPKFLLLSLAISGIALAQQYSKDEALQRIVQAHDSAVLLATSALNLDQQSSCATNSKPLPLNKKRKPKGGTKNGRS
ncbi:MAG: hypothetical protein ABI771_17770 [Betaproteobacteria bacterium]